MLDVTGESSYPFVMSSPVDSLDDDTFVSVGEAANKVVEKLKEARMDRQTRPGMADPSVEIIFRARQAAVKLYALGREEDLSPVTAKALAETAEEALAILSSAVHILNLSSEG